MKKKFSNLKSLKYKKNNNNKNNTKKIKYHLDDKGRRVFDFSTINFDNNPKNIIITSDDNIITKDSLIKEKQIQKQKRYENLNKNLSKSKFRCTICDLPFTDNISLQEHLNSKNHNKLIGNELKIKESNINNIKQKLLNKKHEREKIKLKLKEERLKSNLI